MAIEWGAWETAGGNGLQVGIEVSRTSVSNGSGSVTFTFKVYTRNRYSYSQNDLRLNFGGDWGSGGINFNNRQGADIITLRATRTWKYEYGSTSYGSSPGSRTFSAAVSGAYNGVTPSKTVSNTIPARPIAAPAAPTGISLNRVGDDVIGAHWDNHSTPGRPYEWLTMQMSTDGGDWRTKWTDTSNPSNRQMFGFGPNHAYRFRIRANNSAGSSGWLTSNVTYTTPAAPSNLRAALQANGSALLTWTNQVGYPGWTIRIDRNVDGSGWVTRTSGLIANNWTDPNPPAGSVRYRLRAVSSTNLTSDWATSAPLGTAPPPPTGVRASVQAAGIRVVWVNRVSYTSYSVDVQRAADGGAWITVATNLPAGTTQWTDTLPGTGLNVYRVRCVGIGFTPSSWVESNSVSTDANMVGSPGGPDNLTPDFAAAVDSTQPVTLTWTHDTDAPPQTRYQIQHQMGGADEWTTLPAVTSTIASHELPAGVAADGTIVDWQVRTQGDPAGGWGPWSPTASMIGARCKTWDGTQWIPVPLLAWDGSDWIPRPVLVRAGNQWV